MSTPYSVWKMLKEAFGGVGVQSGLPYLCEAPWRKWDMSWAWKDGNDLSGHNVGGGALKGGKGSKGTLAAICLTVLEKQWATEMVKIKCWCRAELARMPHPVSELQIIVGNCLNLCEEGGWEGKRSMASCGHLPLAQELSSRVREVAVGMEGLWFQVYMFPVCLV